MKLNMIYGKAPLFQELISKLVALQEAIKKPPHTSPTYPSLAG